jgi:transcriptional regulator with GAF, ATPase, and Fis domain
MPVLRFQNPADRTIKMVPLYKKVTTVGSSADSDVILPGKGIQSNHANIFFDGRSYTLQASQAQNEVIVDGKAIRRRKLDEGATIQIGPYIIRYYDSLPPEEGSRAPGAAADGGRAAAEAIEVATYRRMFDLSTRLLHEYRMQPLLEAVMDSVIHLVSADKGFLILLENGALRVKVARNVKRENIEDALEKVSDSIIGRVIRSREPLIVSDALHDLDFKSSESVVNLKLCSVMCVPLLHKDEIFGIIYVGNDRVVSLFDERSLRALVIFSAQIALILQSGMRLDQAEASAKALSDQLKQMQFGEVIGTAPLMQEVFRKVARVAPTDVSVLIEGETGTGKEVIAREIHRRSTRSTSPFVAINCAAIPDDLLESELFGHVRGAFTGAVTTRAGRFQQANHGTVFLDEIGDMPLSLQLKILSAINDRKVTKVGDSHPEEVDIRIVAATNQDLEAAVRENRFREDLFYRLNVVRLVLPPLRDRGDDIVLIARYLLQRYAKEYESKAKGFSPAAIEAMKKYYWPGNVREMENRIKKAAILAEKLTVDIDELDLRNVESQPILPLAQAREEFQMRYIQEVLARNHGNRTKTAKDLGVDPRTIFRYLERMPESPGGGNNKK